MIKLTGFIIGCLIIISGVFFFKTPVTISPEKHHQVDNTGSSNTEEKQQISHNPDYHEKSEKEKNAPAVTAAKSNNTKAGDDSNPINTTTPETAAEIQQEIFWQPFHSRYSASGFARRITRETGIQITVVELSTDRFQVAFDFLDASEQQEKMALIERITGLKIKPANK